MQSGVCLAQSKAKKSSRATGSATSKLWNERLPQKDQQLEGRQGSGHAHTQCICPATDPWHHSFEKVGGIPRSNQTRQLSPSLFLQASLCLRKAREKRRSCHDGNRQVKKIDESGSRIALMQLVR